MIELAKYKIIDLTMELCPTIIKADNRRIYPKPSPGMTWDQTMAHYGQGYKHLFLKQVINAADKHWMHYVEMESHLATHAEVGSHLRYEDPNTGEDITPKGLLDCAQTPVEQGIGEASVFNFSNKKGQEITVKDFERVREGDIVLVWSNLLGNDRPVITTEAMKYLIFQKKIKQFGGTAPSCGVRNKRDREFNVHNALMENNIIFLEGIINLNKITKERVFYIGTILPIQGLDACPVRAIVLEEKD